MTPTASNLSYPSGNLDSIVVGRLRLIRKLYDPSSILQWKSKRNESRKIVHRNQLRSKARRLRRCKRSRKHKSFFVQYMRAHMNILHHRHAPACLTRLIEEKEKRDEIKKKPQKISGNSFCCCCYLWWLMLSLLNHESRRANTQRNISHVCSQHQYTYSYTNMKPISNISFHFSFACIQSRFCDVENENCIDCRECALYLYSLQFILPSISNDLCCSCVSLLLCGCGYYQRFRMKYVCWWIIIARLINTSAKIGNGNDIGEIVYGMFISMQWYTKYGPKQSQHTYTHVKWSNMYDFDKRLTNSFASNFEFVDTNPPKLYVYHTGHH